MSKTVEQLEQDYLDAIAAASAYYASAYYAAADADAARAYKLWQAALTKEKNNE